jgi:replicative DNA helicase
MALAPALDLRPASHDPTPAHAPANVEAEQALLGALLYDNGAYERLNDSLQAAHFFEPFHGRLFSAVEANVRRGQLADPTLLAQQFQSDPAFQELGGVRYLADLVDRAPPAARAADYARAIYDLALRRELRSRPPRRSSTTRPPPATRSRRPSSNCTRWPKPARRRTACSAST